jgi:hypothetical protein
MMESKEVVLFNRYFGDKPENMKGVAVAKART